MTLILVVIHYIFEDHTQNHVDRAWIQFVIPKSWRKLGTTGWNQWTKAATAALLTYSDTQVITGIAILLAGYWQLRCGILLYHWKVISNLAWFSSVTHIATLTSLRKYFQQRLTLAYFRTTAMAINLILLGIASGPANLIKGRVSIRDEGNPDLRPVKCFYEMGFNEMDYVQNLQLNGPILIASLTFLVVSYTIRVIRISTTCSRITRKWLKDKPGDWLKKNHSKAIDNQAKMQNPVQRRLWCFWKRLLTLSYVVLKALCEVGNSMLWEVCSFVYWLYTTSLFPSLFLILLGWPCLKILWLLAAFSWGTIKLATLRATHHMEEEHVWGFGQILAVFLSILPIWSIFGGIYGMLYLHVSEWHWSDVIIEIRKKEPIVVELRAYTPDENGTEPFPVSSLAFSSSEIFESQWYPKVLTLIFLLAIVPIGFALWWVYLGMTSSFLMSAGFLLRLFIQLVTHAFVLVIFTALCLYLHFNSLPPLRVLSIRYHRVDSKKKNTIQQCFWGLWVGFMTLGLCVFNFFVIQYGWCGSLRVGWRVNPLCIRICVEVFIFSHYHAACASANMHVTPL